MIIQDEALGKFEIEVDSRQFILRESGKNPEGFFTTLEAAIKRVIKIRLAEKKDIVSLKEFLDEYQKLLDRLSKLGI